MGGAMAQDLEIEKCLLAGKCTYSVTGDKSFLLQVWYSCFTCNLRTNYGMSQLQAPVPRRTRCIRAQIFSFHLRLRTRPSIGQEALRFEAVSVRWRAQCQARKGPLLLQPR